MLQAKHDMKIRQSQSLVPPSIGKQTSTHVTLFWRTTRGQRSIRTEECVNVDNSKEWINLEQDTKRDEDTESRAEKRRGRIPYKLDAATNIVSKVQVLEIDHVELQTCLCGCSQCVPGVEIEKGEPTTSTRSKDSIRLGCSACLHCAKEREHAPIRGMGCWRSVYCGTERSCNVRLEQSNALQHFRLFVRARKPPPERRGYMRPMHQDAPHSDANSRSSHSPYFPQDVNNQSPHSPHLPQVQVRLPQAGANQRRQWQLDPSAGVYKSTDSCDVESTISTLQDGLGRISRGTTFYRDSTPPQTTAATVMNGGDIMTASDGEPWQWFVSAPVFVGSLPPPVTLHGLGTTLAITWPPLSSFSGLEYVSYILEQWSRPVLQPIESETKLQSPQRQQQKPLTTTTTIGGENHATQDNLEDRGNCTTRQYMRPRSRNRRRCRPRPIAAHGNEAKEVFSVGTRCWFVPTSLVAGNVYRYRLSLLHQRGRSVAGPWASYLSSVPPPRCVDAGARCVLISLPTVCSAAGSCVGSKRVRTPEVEGAAKEMLSTAGAIVDTCPEESGENQANDISGTDGMGETLSVTAPRSRTNSGELSGEEETGARYQGGNSPWEAEETETPVVRYRLKGLNGSGRWSLIYQGSDPEVLVQGLQPNTFFSIRVTVDVDVMELRRRALGPLSSLSLEPAPSPLPAPAGDAVSRSPPLDRDADRTVNTTSLRTDDTCPETQRRCWRLGEDLPSKNLVQPAARKGVVSTGLGAGGTVSCLRITSPGDGSGNGSQLRSRLPWSPSTSPVMSQLKKEGFAVHDAAGTVGSGYYLERPPWSPLGDAVESCQRDSGVRWDARGLGCVYTCPNTSEPTVFATALQALFFTSFVLDGVPQVNVWWPTPRQLVDVDTGRRFPLPLVGGCRSSDTPVTCASASTSAATKTRCKRSSTTAPMISFARKTHSAPQKHSRGGKKCAHSPTFFPHQQQRQQRQQYPFYVLEALDPVSTDMQPVYAGRNQWTNLPRISATLPLAPATAYFLKLSAKVSAEQPETEALGVVFTAPPAPVLELVGGGVPSSPSLAEATEENGGHGGDDTLIGVKLKVFWVNAVYKEFLPAVETSEGEEIVKSKIPLPPVSVALEMSPAWEAGLPDRGAGGIKSRISRSTARPSTTEQAGELTPGGRETQMDVPLSSDGGDREPVDTASDDFSVVRTDAGGGMCWMLDSSTWDRAPEGTPAGAFQIVWRGFDGETEAFTPSLPPGMRFAFRMRVECCLGVAYSPATVYQTAFVVPRPPRGLRVSVGTHESRVGRTANCLRLSWGPSEPGHGRNVVTSFTVQARRHCGENGGDISWHDVCSCPQASCLDPDTLGMPRVTADYRVRGEGPGGCGPWCKPLPVNLVVTEESLDAASAECTTSVLCKEGSTVATDSLLRRDRTGEPERCPMAYRRSGSTERDSLTGEARRAWGTGKVMGRPLQMRPPSPSVAAAVSGKSLAAAISMKAMASDGLHRRAGGSKQLLWGALASPREEQISRAAAAMKRGGAVGTSDGTNITVAASADSQTSCTDTHDGPDREQDGENRDHGGNGNAGNDQLNNETGCNQCETVVQQSRSFEVGPMSSEAMPQALAMLLREELDISPSTASGFDLSTHAMQMERWRRLAEGGTAEPGPDGLARRNPGCPAVTWEIPAFSTRVLEEDTHCDQQDRHREICNPTNSPQSKSTTGLHQIQIQTGRSRQRQPRVERDLGAARRDDARRGRSISVVEYRSRRGRQRRSCSRQSC